MAAKGPVTEPPPAGGYGGGPPSRRFGPEAATESGGGAGRNLRKPLVHFAIIVASLSSVLVVVVVGCRRYIRVAKTGEARFRLAEIAKDAVAAHAAAHRVCPSATQPVPPERKMIRGMKYQSIAADWRVDQATNAGFACLAFEITAPQYFQYRYDATATSFDARGYGDLNGDGVFSEFTWSGEVKGDRLIIDRSVTVKDEGE